MEASSLMGATIKLSSPATPLRGNEATAAAQAREFWEITVLFEDETLLALDKPAGLLLSPDPGEPQRPNLMSLLHAGIAEAKPWARERGLAYLNNLHRLDSEISGVLLLAKSKPIFTSLADLFGSEQPIKKYVALVQGSPADEHFQMNAKLAPHPVNAGLHQVDPKNGKKAQTRFSVLEKFSRWTLLQCEPLTDRPHQIRVQLQNLGLPVVGDEIYGGKPLWLSRIKPNFRLKPGHEERPLISSPALHAEELKFPHPVTHQPLTITAPWPKDLKVAVKYLRQFAGNDRR